MVTGRKRTRGFTLVELLIVVAVLGILAAVVIPQFTTSTEDAKTATLEASLAQLRAAVELYYHQHGGDYPGAKNSADGADAATPAIAATSFVNQLTLYSESDGTTSNSRTADAKYGPYIKRSIPPNPFNENSGVVCDIATTDITAAASDGTTGWIFFVETGVLLANDGAHDSY